MADARAGLYLISYDIADPKRLARTHRILKREGLPLQYSVFSAVLKKRRLSGLLKAIDGVIDPREDDVRCYRLPEIPESHLLGRQFFPEDVMLFTGGVNRLLNSG